MTSPAARGGAHPNSTRPRIRRTRVVAGTVLGIMLLSLVVVPVSAGAAAKRGVNPAKALQRTASSLVHAVTKHRSDAGWRWDSRGRGKTTPKPLPAPTATATATPTAATTPTVAPTPTLAPTVAPTPTLAPTVPVTPTAAPTTSTPAVPPATASATPTVTPTPTRTATPTPTATATPIPTITVTPTPSTTAAPPAATGPSGLAMPKGDLDGWKQVFADDFAGTKLSSNWGAYSGQPGGNPAGWWMPSHTYTNGGNLVLDGYADGGKNASGGAAAWGASQLTYGKYDVRFRADVGHGYGYVFLLWPVSGVWPNDGEIDFAEDGGDNRQNTAATLHYGANNSQIARNLSGDFSKWHNLGVEWTPGKLVYTLDGKPWSTVTGSMVPSKPMFLAVQQAALPCSQWSTCVDSTTPAHTKIEIDWVSVYAQSSTATAPAASGSAGLIALPIGLLGALTPAIVRTRRPSRRRATS